VSVISPHAADPARFWSDLFELQVDSAWLAARFGRLSKEECMHEQKVRLDIIVYSRPFDRIVDSAGHNIQRGIAILRTTGL